MRAGCSRVTHPCAGRRQKYCYPRAAPRLACVRPAASVHPEPGSNSSLYILYISSPNPRTPIPLKKSTLSNLFRYFACTASSSLVNDLLYPNPEPLRLLSSIAPGTSRTPLFPNGIAKVLLFPEPPNFSQLFLIFFCPNRLANDHHHPPSYCQMSGCQRRKRKSAWPYLTARLTEKIIKSIRTDYKPTGDVSGRQSGDGLPVRRRTGDVLGVLRDAI